MAANTREGLAWITRSQAYLLERDYASYARWFLEYVDASPGDCVLDCGIGTGETTAFQLVEKGVNVFGVDLNPVLLNACNRKANDKTLSIGNTLADIQKLPFRDEVFDAVYSFASSWYLADLNAALAEMRRVLKPGGTLTFDVINLWHPFQFMTYLHYRMCKSRLYLALRVANRIREGRPVDELLAPRGSSSWEFYPHTPPQIASLLERFRLDFDVKGFFVLLPLALPGLGQRGNLCKYSPLLASQVRDNPVLKHLGAKLVFVCRKTAIPERDASSTPLSSGRATA